MTQPEALRLADELDHGVGTIDRVRHAAASELRRLHVENERLRVDGIHSCHAECQRPVCRLTRERGALLEALRYHQEQTRPIQRSIDVIKAVEEGK